LADFQTKFEKQLEEFLKAKGYSNEVSLSGRVSLSLRLKDLLGPVTRVKKKKKKEKKVSLYLNPKP